MSVIPIMWLISMSFKSKATVYPQELTSYQYKPSSSKQKQFVAKLSKVASLSRSFINEGSDCSF